VGGSTTTYSGSYTCTGTCAGAWSSSNGSIAIIGTTSGLLTGLSGGTVTITYTVIDNSDLCTNFTTVTAEVDYYSAMISGNPVICPESTETLTNGSFGGTYSWSSSDTFFARIGGTGMVTGVSGPGTSTISLSVSNVCTGGSPVYSTMVLFVLAPPNVYNVEPTGNPPAPTLVYLSNSDAGVKYQLYHDNLSSPTGLPVTGPGGVSINFYSEGNGTYYAIGTDTTTGCSIEMAGYCDVGDGMRIANTGNEAPPATVAEPGLMIIPNPNTGSFTLSGYALFLTRDAEAKIEITDMAGRKVFTGMTPVSNGGVNKVISLNNVSNGLYQIRISTNEGSALLRLSVLR
jgi:hypothetical protein